MQSLLVYVLRKLSCVIIICVSTKFNDASVILVTKLMVLPRPPLLIPSTRGQMTIIILRKVTK